MKNFLLLILGSIMLVFISCGDEDEPTPPHEVGSWELDSYVMINFPSTFSRYEDLALEIDGISFGGVTYEEYLIELNNDGTASVEIDVVGPAIEEEGTWEIDDDELEMEMESGELVWEIQKNEDDDLWLSEEVQFQFIPNIYFDTVSEAYIDYLGTLTEAQEDSIDDILFQPVTLDLVYIFERDN